MDWRVPAKFVLDNVIEDSAEIAVAAYVAHTQVNLRFASTLLIPYNYFRLL
jgi:hypothetical protein